MAAKAFVISYGSQFVDQQHSPNVLGFTVNYVVSDAATGLGLVGSVAVTLGLSDSSATQAAKIRQAIIDDITNHELRPDLVPLTTNVGILAYQ